MPGKKWYDMEVIGIFRIGIYIDLILLRYNQAKLPICVPERIVYP